MVDAASVLPGTIAASIGIVFLCIIGLAITFYGICVVCDNYLVPTVEVFIKQFKVPESIAAVTLVAFGSAAPELVLNSIGAIEQTSDISLAAVLGSAMIVSRWSLHYLSHMTNLLRLQSTIELTSKFIVKLGLITITATIICLGVWADSSFVLAW
jgi:Ca2+/Na+ antiporter